MENKDYKRSNFLISAKYKASLLENRIMAVSLAKISSLDYVEEQGNLIVRLRAAELKSMFRSKSNSFYDRLDAVSRTMTGRTIGWTNPEEKSFQYISVITRAEYQNGVFSVEFNRHLKKYIKDLESNFTILNLPTLLSFEHDSSFRLFELLKSRAYVNKGCYDPGVYEIEFGLAELKLELGAVNANLDKVQKTLQGQEAPDFEKAIALAPEHTYDRWCDFDKWILKVACKEINENDKADITVSYKPYGAGRGGKIYKVAFTVTKKKDKEKLSKEERLTFIDDMMDILDGYGLRMKDYDALAEAAGYDLAKIKDAKQAMLSYKGIIEDKTAFLLACIKKPHKKDGASQKSGKKKNASQANFPQRQYDFDALERRLLQGQ